MALTDSQLQALNGHLTGVMDGNVDDIVRRISPAVEQIAAERVEATLAAAEQRFETLITNLPDGVQIPRGYHDLIKQLVRAAHTGAVLEEGT